MPLVTVNNPDGTTSDVEGISLGEVHPGVETFLVIDASNHVVAYRQPTAAAQKATDDAAAAVAPVPGPTTTSPTTGQTVDAATGQPAPVPADTDAGTAEDTADRAGWKFDPVTGQPV